MFRRKLAKQGQRIDAARLSLFHIDEGERPIETIVGWMPLGFANNPGMSDGTWFTSVPPDGAMGLSHDQWFDVEDSEARGALWGHGIAIAHVLVLVTDRRLIWLPIDAETAMTRGATTYPTFASDALGQRSIDLTSIEFIEPIDMDTVDDLPGGLSVSSFVRLQLIPNASVGGAPYPIWAPPLIAGWTSKGNDLHILITSGQEFIGDLLSIALDHAGVAVHPPTWASESLDNRPKWKPAYVRSIEP